MRFQLKSGLSGHDNVADVGRACFKSRMNSFIYSVWFLDTRALEGEQNREWVACIGIQATTATEAQKWGDTLAHERSRRFPQDTFASSSVELECEVEGVTDWSNLPRISAGETATDAIIGW